MVKLFAMAVPVTKGKEQEWKDFADELSGSRKEAFVASRRKLGIRERTFLQHTPVGDMVIVTWEGKNPEKALIEFAQGNDEFTQWFLEKIKQVHGIDLTAPPEGHISQLFIDSES